jgi:hypothetical protein
MKFDERSPIFKAEYQKVASEALRAAQKECDRAKKEMDGYFETMRARVAKAASRRPRKYRGGRPKYRAWAEYIRMILDDEEMGERITQLDEMHEFVESVRENLDFRHRPNMGPARFYCDKARDRLIAKGHTFNGWYIERKLRGGEPMK